MTLTEVSPIKVIVEETRWRAKCRADVLGLNPNQVKLVFDDASALSLRGMTLDRSEIDWSFGSPGLMAERILSMVQRHRE